MSTRGKDADIRRKRMMKTLQLLISDNNRTKPLYVIKEKGLFIKNNRHENQLNWILIISSVKITRINARKKKKKKKTKTPSPPLD